MSDGWGGARKNAGRKKGLAKQIEAKAIEQAGDDACYALGLNVAWMRDSSLPIEFRKVCADTVMDRVWGKATQKNQTDNTGTLEIIVKHVQKHNPGGPATTPAAATGEE